MSSYLGTAGAAFLPQVYRNTRVATRKRRAAPQLPSTVFTQVMAYVPEECSAITNNAERCDASFKYRNQLNQQPMDCSHYCSQHIALWLSSVLQDLAQMEYLSFVIPSLNNRAYQSEYILHPIKFKVTISSGYERSIDLNLDTPDSEIEEYVADLSQPIY